MSSQHSKYAKKTEYLEYKHYQIERGEHGFFVIMKAEAGCMYCTTLEQAKRYIDLIAEYKGEESGNS